MSTTASQQKAYVKLEIVIAARFSAGFDASMAVGQMQLEAAEIKIGQPVRNDAVGDIF